MVNVGIGRLGRALHRVGYYRTGTQIQGYCELGVVRNWFGRGKIVGYPGGISLLEEERVLASIQNAAMSPQVRKLQLEAFLGGDMTFDHAELSDVRAALENAQRPEISTPELLPLVEEAIVKVDGLIVDRTETAEPAAPAITGESEVVDAEPASEGPSVIELDQAAVKTAPAAPAAVADEDHSLFPRADALAPAPVSADEADPATLPSSAIDLIEEPSSAAIDATDLVEEEIAEAAEEAEELADEQLAAPAADVDEQEAATAPSAAVEPLEEAEAADAAPIEDLEVVAPEEEAASVATTEVAAAAAALVEDTANFSPVALETHVVDGKHEYYIYPEVDYAPFATGTNFSWLDQLALHRRNLETSLTAMLAGIATLDSQRADSNLWLEAARAAIVTTERPYKEQISALEQIREALAEFLTEVTRAEEEASQQIEEIRAESPKNEKPSERVRRLRDRSRRIEGVEDELLSRIDELEGAIDTQLQPLVAAVQAELEVDSLLRLDGSDMRSLTVGTMSSLEKELGAALAQTVPLSVGTHTEDRQVVLKDEEARLIEERARLGTERAQVVDHHQITLAQLRGITEQGLALQRQQADLLAPLVSPISPDLEIKEVDPPEEG